MDMKTLMRNQIQEALKHKWLKGVERGCDPGPEAINEWIETHSENYRKEYDRCFAALLAATMEKAWPRLREIFPDVGRDEMSETARVILEEFTKIWFLEMTKSDADRHAEEI